MPVPESVVVWFEPATFPLLSVTIKLAEYAVAAAGVKVTDILQLAATASAAPQLLVCANSLGFVPPSAMLAIDRVAVPVLLRVTMVGELVVATNCEVNATELGARPPAERV